MARKLDPLYSRHRSNTGTLTSGYTYNKKIFFFYFQSKARFSESAFDLSLVEGSRIANVSTFNTNLAVAPNFVHYTF